MNIICKIHGGGKTHDIIKMSLEKDIPILCLNEENMINILTRSYTYFGKRCKTVILGEKCDTKVLVDDAEVMLEYLLKKNGYNVSTIAISKE